MATPRPRHKLASPYRPRQARTARPFRPGLTALESRLLLAVITVDDSGGADHLTISAAVAAAAAGDTISVAAGTYVEDVNVNKTLALLGAGPATTTISGAIGSDGATVRIGANNVEVAGFTITREGNNPTDWDNPGLNSVGVAVQGQAGTGMLVHDNLITGNRTAIDVNNSSGHTVRNNVITNNRTGLIFRNQTDNLTVVENAITNNWTVGVLFLDASEGTNSPVQTALNSTFSNNDISANWYGQIVDRQAGGSLPLPGTTNLKNFSGNWLGTTAPVITTANSAEPGYAVLIPVVFGGTAVAPGGQPDVAGPASANFDITPLLGTGTDTDVETATGRGTFGFQGSFASLVVTAAGAQVGATGRIQEGVNLVTTGGTVNVAAGTYTENFTIGKALDLIGQAPGATVLKPSAGGNLITINGSSFGGDETVTIDDFNFDGTGVANDYAIRVQNTASFANLTVTDSVFTGFDFNAIAVFGNATTGLSARDVDLGNLTFSSNGANGGGGTGDVQLFEYNGDASLTGLVLVGNATASTGPRGGIQLRGVGAANGSGVLPLGTVAFDGVDVSGTYRTQFIGLQRYSSAAGLSLDDVALGGATSEITGAFGAGLRFDAVGLGTLASPAAVDLGNTLFRGLAGTSAQRHELEIAPDNSHTFLRADATGTTWTLAGVDVAAGDLTLDQAFAVEDRILHYVDKLNPTHGTYKGFADVQAGRAFITDSPDSGLVGDGSIQRGVDVVAAGATVHVEAGTYVEQLDIAKALTLQGQGQGATIVQSPAVLATKFLNASSVPVRPVVHVHDAAGVTIRDLTVDGAGTGNANNILVGIEYFDAGGTIDDVTVTGVRHAPLNGVQGGLAIEARNNDAAARTLSITDSTVQDYQKNGITLRGTGLTVNVLRNTITGAGPTELIAQNGIQFSGGASGLIQDNDIGGHSFIPATVFSYGILIFDAVGTVTVDDNRVYGNDGGLYAVNSTTSITGNVFGEDALGDPTENLYDNIDLDQGGHTVAGNEIVGGDYGVSLFSYSGVTAEAVATIHRNTITGAAVAGVLVSDDADDAFRARATITENFITGNATGIAVADATTGPGVVTAICNDLSGNTTGLSNSGPLVNAEQNWWGSATGPQHASNPGGTGVPVSAGVDFTPWLTSGVDQEPGTPGFQCDTSGLDSVAPTNLALTVSPNPVNEGSPTSLSGTFDDFDPSNTETHTVTISWGDGTPNTVLNLAAGVRSFSGVAHTYADDNPSGTSSDPYTITVTVADATSNSTSASTGVTVANVSPAPTLTGIPAGNTSPEGTTITLGRNPNDPGTDTFQDFWQALKNGSSFASGTGPTFSFTPNDNGSYTVILTTLDDDLGVGATSASIAVTNVAPTVAITGAPATSPEGTAISLGSTASDPSPVDTLSYSWSVTASNGQAIPGGTGTSFSFTPNDEGTYTVSLTVTDDDGGATTDTEVIAVTNVAPTATFSNGGPVAEGSTGSVSFSGQVEPSTVDAASLRYSYDFNNDGDFIDAGEIADSPSPSATVPAAYLADGPGSRTVRGRIADEDGGFTDYTTTITITNVAPTVAIVGSPATSPEGTAIGLGSTASDPGTADTLSYSWSVTASNGQAVPGGTGASFTFTPNDNGSYVVTLVVTDKDGGTGTDTETVTVTNVNPSAILSNGSPYDEGSPGAVFFTNQADPSTVDLGSLRYSYDFNNDGTFEITNTASSAVVVPAGFLADGPGTRTVRARVSDKDAGSTDYTTTITITNVAPTATFSGNGPAFPGRPATVSFSNQADPSPVDTAAGFTYSYDFDNDNVFEVANSTSPSQSHTFAAVGDYTVRGRITDKDGGSTIYTTTVSVATGIIVDDGDPGYSQAGAWTTASDFPTSYGPTYRYAAAGTGTASASWQLDATAPGSYDVQVTWTAASNRASDAPYRIFDGATLIKTVYVDQRQAPVGPTVGAVAFQSLGIATIVSGPLRVVLDNDADSFVIADAARALAAALPVAVDDGQAGYSQAGAWTTANDFPTSYGPTYRYAAAGDGSAIAGWQLDTAAAGHHDVQVTWTAAANRASDAPYRIYDGATLIKTVRVDQRQAPSGPTVGGVPFQSLGVVSVSQGGLLRVELGNDADNFVIADAARAVAAVAPTALDDGQPGYSQSGAWTTASDFPTSFGPTYRYAAAGDGSVTASWQFDAGFPGSVDVQVTWTAAANRASNAPYRIYDGNTLLKTVRVDQRRAPAGLTIGGVAFQSLGIVPVTTGVLRVELGNDADSFVIADAVRALPAAPPVAVDDGSPGYVQEGPWTTAADFPTSFGPTYRYAPAGTGSATASWQLDATAGGLYEVQVSWTAAGNRASDAPYRIYDGPTLLTTVRVDQRQAPAGAGLGGVAFQSLGAFTTTTGALRVELGNDADNFVIADAVRVEQVAPLMLEGEPGRGGGVPAGPGGRRSRRWSTRPSPGGRAPGSMRRPWPSSGARRSVSPTCREPPSAWSRRAASPWIGMPRVGAGSSTRLPTMTASSARSSPRRPATGWTSSRSSPMRWATCSGSITTTT